MAEQSSDTHFTKVFWFAVFNAGIVYVYLFTITFLNIPKENQRFVDISIGFLLGTILGNIMGFLFGGSIQQAPKKAAPTGTTTADISATITTEAESKTSDKL